MLAGGPGGAWDGASDMSASDIARVKEKLAALLGRAADRAPRPVTAPIVRQTVSFPGGQEVATPFGPAYFIERPQALGPSTLGHAHDLEVIAAPGALACLSSDTRWPAIPLERVLLLDTETTGLAGGTGTYVFLAGLGYFTLGASGGLEFTVRQYFLRELGEEQAFLHGLATFLSRFEALVTFNGKSFDWPLLATRFLLRQADEVRREWPHLDLLHPARRIWKHRLPSCGLGALESAVFGLERELDVPGALIPELYFRYLRDRDAVPLHPVLAHNERDITTLLALLVHLAQLTNASHEHPAHYALRGADHFGLAGLLLALGRPASSSIAYRRALEDPALPAPLRRAAMTALATTLKREGHWEEAAAVWRRLVLLEARRRAPDATGHIELAKYHEHVRRDYEAALGTVDAALALLEVRGVTSGVEALLHRRSRLAYKLARAPAGARSRRVRDVEPRVARLIAARSPLSSRYAVARGRVGDVGENSRGHRKI